MPDIEPIIMPICNGAHNGAAFGAAIPFAARSVSFMIARCLSRWRLQACLMGYAPIQVSSVLEGQPEPTPVTGNVEIGGTLHRICR
jgi:hypothetical protein